MTACRRLGFLILAAVLPWTVLAEESGVAPTIAIIIDDMGHNAVQESRLIRLEQPLTLAFLPFRPYTTALARQAHQHQKEVMLHAPMANTRLIGLGAGGLSPEMNREQVAQTLRRALRSLPHVQGVNNHMGSLLTQMEQPMSWVMEELHNFPLYFIDSRTIASSIAGRVAEQHQVPTMTRDVFLDHEATEEFVHQQFQLLIRKAKENGTAIGIGHPYEVTISYLEKALPALDEEGIAVATVSAVWAIRNNNERMFADGEKRLISPSLVRTANSSD